MSPASASAAVCALEKRDLIRRERDSPRRDRYCIDDRTWYRTTLNLARASDEKVKAARRGAEIFLHHIGLWSDDVPSESDRLVAGGLPLVQRDLDVATGAMICYHRTSDDLRLEITDIGRGGPSVANYLGGAYDKLLLGR